MGEDWERNLIVDVVMMISQKGNGRGSAGFWADGPAQDDFIL